MKFFELFDSHDFTMFCSNGCVLFELASKSSLRNSVFFTKESLRFTAGLILVYECSFEVFFIANIFVVCGRVDT